MVKFSVVVPVYNCEKYISQCIESVINQTYSNFELILIDDGSSDNSGRICDCYTNDTRIKVLHTENRGMVKARISGIQMATGDYLLGLDSDDYLELQCLEIVNRTIEQSGCDMVLFAHRLFGDISETIPTNLQPYKNYSQRELVKAVLEFTDHCLWNKAIKIEALKAAIEDTVAERISVNADYAQIIPALCHVGNGYVIADVLYNYRIYGTSISHAVKVQHIIDTDYVTQNVLLTLTKFGLLDKEIEDITYISFLKMISTRLYSLFLSGKINKEDCRKIQKLTIYNEAKQYEKKENFSWGTLVFLKMFRFKLFGLIEIAIKMKVK